MALRGIDGGPGYFSQFANSLPTDPNFFPIGVWFESVTSQTDINLDKAAGLNTYVVLTASSNLSLVQNNGMHAILQDEWFTNPAAINSPAVNGWLLADEIDMTQGPGAGYTTLNNLLASLPHDGRMTYANYSKGVVFWETDADAARFVNDFQDLTSADNYWFTNLNLASSSEGGALLNNGNPLTLAQTRLAANYGYTVDRMRELDGMDGVHQPIWAFVEVGWPFADAAADGGRAIAPEEIQAAVWHSIIAGARGVIYFNHSFGGPDQTQHALRDPAYAAERAAVASTDALIAQLAPVLNSPFDDDWVTTSGPSVRVMAKFYNGDHFVFAGSTQNNPSTITYTLAGVGDGAATVINENRTIAITSGHFSDFFADGNAIHIYQIDEGLPPPPPPPDTTPPLAPSIVNFSPDTAPANDGHTTATTITLSGTGEANSTIKVMEGLTVLGTVNETNGTWSFTTGVLPVGTHSFTATDTDAAGNVSPVSSPFSVTIDAAPPPPPPPPGTLVVNGGFETGNFSGWTKGGNTAGIYIAPTDFPGAPHSGTFSAGFGSFDTDGTFTQTVVTIAGQHYTFSFWAKEDGGTPDHFAAFWDGATLLNLTNAPQGSYTQYSFDVVGTGSDTLKFSGFNNPDAWRLDDVSVTAVGAPPVLAGSVSINDVTISEGDSGTKVAIFTVTRSGGTAAFDVNYATSNGTATVADGDYVVASNTLHFGANQNTQTISVTINGDTKVESNETFDVDLSNATNGATISDNQGVGTITNDDSAPTANLVANGGFETGDFRGWTLSGNSSANQVYIAPTAFPGEVHTGSYSAGMGSMNRTDGILTQNIATTAGQHYTLSFWIESDNNGSTPINHFAAEWNGQTLMALTDAPDSGYQLYTFDVVGINGNSVLEFDGYNHPDAWRLDDVTLSAVGGAAPVVFTSGADTVTLPALGGTFNTLGGDDKLVYTGGPVTIDGGTGSDTLDFSQFGSAMWVNLSSNGPEIQTQDRPDLSSGTWRAVGDVTNVENLVGTPYSDFLQGDKRANTLQGGHGNNTLTGAGGADTFVFDHLGAGSQDQHDVIVDFQPGVDRIDLAATPVNDFADLFTVGDRYMEQVGNDILIHTSVSADTSILLQGVQLASLTQFDFLF